MKSKIVNRKSKINTMFRYIFFIGIVVLIGACGGNSNSKDEEPLAKVYDKILYPSDLKGIIQPKLAKLFKADQIAEAHDFLESRQSIGKIVLEW